MQCELARFRLLHKLTREEVSRRIGWPIPTIERIESGNFKPTRPLLRKLAAALNVPVEELVGEGSARNRPGNRRLERQTVTPAEIGQVLGLSRSTIYNLLHEGKIRTKRVGNRFVTRRAAIDEFLEGG